MNVGYLAPYNDGTGIGNAAVANILALDAAEVDVKPVETKMASQIVPAPERVQTLAKTYWSFPPDVVIQHNLPVTFCYRSGFLNVGYFHTETTNFTSSQWQHYLNLMDLVLVNCEENLDAAIGSGVTKPIEIIPIACDPQKYHQDYRYHLDLQIPESTYVFYSISDYSERKNVRTVIKQYLSTFSSYDNVLLVLKCYVEGHNSHQSREYLTNEINQIKQSLRLKQSNYPKIKLITDYLTDEQIQAIHQQGDCYVSAERAAAWNIPAFEAMAYNKGVIANGWGGQTSFLKEYHNAELMQYHMSDVCGMDHCPYPNLYTAREHWADPCEDDLDYLFNKFYCERNEHPQRADLTKYSYETVGNQLKEILEKYV